MNHSFHQMEKLAIAALEMKALVILKPITQYIESNFTKFHIYLHLLNHLGLYRLPVRKGFSLVSFRANRLLLMQLLTIQSAEQTQTRKHDKGTELWFTYFRLSKVETCIDIYGAVSTNSRGLELQIFTEERFVFPD